MKVISCSVKVMLLIFCLLVLTGCHRLCVPADASSSKVAIKSFHGRYVSALKENGPGSLAQNPILGECGNFTQYNLANGKIALLNCNGRYVTAPISGSTRADWQLWQDSERGDCSQFVVEKYEQGVALKTCAGRYLTAGDNSWGPLAWSVVAETDQLDKWEIFTIEVQP
jgi:hypothetical protein